MNDKRNIICKLRLNEEEQKLFQKKSERYGGNTSAMIRDAVAHFDDQKTKCKLQALSELLTFYKEYQQKLSWYGGNFNQAMHRANELAIAGELSQQYIEKVIMPKTKDVITLLRAMKARLDDIHDNIEG